MKNLESIHLFLLSPCFVNRNVIVLDIPVECYIKGRARITLSLCLGSRFARFVRGPLCSNMFGYMKALGNCLFVWNDFVMSIACTVLLFRSLTLC